MLKMLLLQMSQLPYYKAFIILGVIYFRLCRVSLAEYLLVLRVLFPTCCRWADVLRLLYQLPLSYDGWCLGPWGMVIPYVSSDAFVGDDHSLALYLNSAWVCVWFEQMASATFIRTGFVITMLKLWCIWDCELLCNMWWWLLNLLRSWLEWKLVWNPSWFHGLPGYTGLSLLNRLLWRMIFLLNFV